MEVVHARLARRRVAAALVEARARRRAARSRRSPRPRARRGRSPRPRRGRASTRPTRTTGTRPRAVHRERPHDVDRDAPRVDVEHRVGEEPPVVGARRACPASGWPARQRRTRSSPACATPTCSVLHAEQLVAVLAVVERLRRARRARTGCGSPRGSCRSRAPSSRAPGSRASARRRTPRGRTAASRSARCSVARPARRTGTPARARRRGACPSGRTGTAAGRPRRSGSPRRPRTPASTGTARRARSAGRGSGSAGRRHAGLLAHERAAVRADVREAVEPVVTVAREQQRLVERPLEQRDRLDARPGPSRGPRRPPTASCARRRARAGAREQRRRPSRPTAGSVRARRMSGSIETADNRSPTVHGDDSATVPAVFARTRAVLRSVDLPCLILAGERHGSVVSAAAAAASNRRDLMAVDERRTRSVDVASAAGGVASRAAARTGRAAGTRSRPGPG